MPTTRSKKFQCQQCSFAATTQNALNSHSRTHNRQNQSPSVIVNTLTAVEKGAIAVSSISNYVNYFMMFLNLVITYPCFSVFMSSVCYTMVLIAYGVILQYIPFFATSGSLVGLTWTAHTHNTLYLKQNPLPYADFMVLYGALPVVADNQENWFQCSVANEKCTKDLEIRGKEILKQIGIMKELINSDWESLGYTEEQAIAMIWNMPTFVESSIPPFVHQDNIRSIHFPDHKSVMPTEKEKEDMDKDYRKSWGISQYTPLTMLNTYTRTLTSWINHKNGTSDMSRHTLYLKLDFIEQQHIPWVKYVMKNKHIDVKEINPIHYSGNNFLTYSNWADDMFVIWNNKGRITNSTYYTKFANLFSTQELKKLNTDSTKQQDAELKILKTGS